MGSAALRGTALLVGLSGYGFSMAVMVRAGLGLDPWDVFHQGLTRHTGMTIGIALPGEMSRNFVLALLVRFTTHRIPG